MNNPFLSVIIPSYNQGAYIANTISSVINQRFQDWEIVIQDGASTDQTRDAVKPFVDSDPRITFRSEKDKGFSDAVNKALSRCRGKFAIIQNSDDFFSGPGVFDSAVSYLTKYPDLYILSAGFKRIDEQFLELLIPAESYPEGFISPSDVFTLKRTFGQSSTFFSIDRVREIGLLSLNVDMVADTDTWVRMANFRPRSERKIYYVPENWSCATFHNEQRSMDQTKFMTGRAQMFTDIFFDKNIDVDDAERKKVALVFVVDAFEYLIERKLPTEKVEAMYQKITGEPMPLKKKIKRNIFQIPGFRKLINGAVQPDGTLYVLTFPRGENARWFN